MSEPLPFKYMAISDKRVCTEPIPDRVDRLAGLGVPAVQLRDKTVADSTRYHWVRQIDDKPDVFLMNGRADIARLGNFQGVHLPEHGLSREIIHTILPNSMIVGRSTHRPEQVRTASTRGYDYVLFGPVFPTPSKPDLTVGDIPGLEGLAEATNTVDIPVLALGGVTPDRIGDCLSAGAYGVAGIRALFQPENPRRNWNKIRNELPDL
jgi:thiamine-phosphate pyrophosphorylase